MASNHVKKLSLERIDDDLIRYEVEVDNEATLQDIIDAYDDMFIRVINGTVKTYKEES